jgi:hypothetical protein
MHASCPAAFLRNADLSSQFQFHLRLCGVVYEYVQYVQYMYNSEISYLDTIQLVAKFNPTITQWATAISTS